MPAPPREIILDIGGVLLDWDPQRLYRRLVPDEAARAALFARVGFEPMNLAADRDGDLEAKVAALAARHPADADLIRLWWTQWEAMCGGLIDGSVALMRAAQAGGAPCWALSNFAADTFRRAQALYPALTEFDGMVISGREGVVKPDRRIYELVETRTGLSGAALFFVDDRAENVEAATARGWRGHRFTAPAGLRRALRAAGAPLA